MPAEPSARIREIEAALASNEASTKAMRVALERLDAAAAEAAAKAKTEARLAQRREARDVVRAMLPLVDQLTPLNDRLAHLQKLSGEPLSLLMAFRPTLMTLEAWSLWAQRYSRGD